MHHTPTAINDDPFVQTVVEYFHLDQKGSRYHEILLNPEILALNIDLTCRKDINLLLHLIAAPDNGNAIITTLNSAILLIETSYCKLDKKKHHQHRKSHDRIIQNCKLFIEKITTTLDNRSLQQYGRKTIHGYKQSHPIYAYCFEIIARINRPDLHQKIRTFGAYLLELLIYNIDIKKIDRSMHPSIGLAARKLIEAPPTNGFKYTDSGQYSIRQRHQLFADLEQWVNPKSDEMVLKDSDITYIRRLIDKSEKVHRIPRSNYGANYYGRKLRLIGADGNDIHETSYDVQSSSIFFDENRLRVTPDDHGNINYSVQLFHTTSDDYEEALNAGEFESELDTGLESFIIPADAIKMGNWPNIKIARTITESITFSKFHNVYDINCCSPKMINKIFSATCNNHEFMAASSRNRKVALLVQLCLFFGFNSQQLLHIRMGKVIDQNEALDIALFQDVLDQPITLDSSERRIHHHYISSVWMDIDNNGEFIEPQDPYSLEIPDFMADLLPDINNYSLLFKKKDLAYARKILKSISNNQKININHLSNAYYAFFVSGAGMPEMSARLISGDYPWYLISQSHYTTINWSHLVKQWNRMLRCFRDNFDKDSEVIIEKMAFEIESKCTICTDHNNDIYVGARRTPDDTALREHFSYLQKLFPNDMHAMQSASIHEWNAYTAYIFGLYAVTTGNRPVSDTPLALKSLDTTNICLFLQDKNSSSHKESRTILPCPTLYQSLQNYACILKHWKAHMLSKGYSLSPQMPGLVMANSKTMTITPFLQSSLDKFLNYPDKPYIYNIKNGYRHYLLSRLAKIGVEQNWIDFIAGHRHGGSEPEYNASPLSWLLIASQLVKIIESEVVDHLNLKGGIYSSE